MSEIEVPETHESLEPPESREAALLLDVSFDTLGRITLDYRDAERPGEPGLCATYSPGEVHRMASHLMSAAIAASGLTDSFLGMVEIRRCRAELGDYLETLGQPVKPGECMVAAMTLWNTIGVMATLDKSVLTRWPWPNKETLPDFVLGNRIQRMACIAALIAIEIDVFNQAVASTEHERQENQQEASGEEMAAAQTAEASDDGC